MKPKNIIHHRLAFAAALIAALSITANTTAQQATGTNLQRPPLVLQDERISSEAQAKEIAWKSYSEIMRGLDGISATENISVADTITLGFNVLGFATKGDKVWDTRINDTKSGIRAIIWVHADTGQAYFVISPLLTTGIIRISPAAPVAVLPAADVIGDIRFDKQGGNAGKTPTAEEFKQMMKTAAPISQEQLRFYSVPFDNTWCSGSLTTVAGVYRFHLARNGAHTLVTPSGASMRFKTQ